MKKKRMLLLKLFLASSIFVIIVFGNTKIVEAYNWSTPIGEFSKVEKIGDNIPNLDENAINLRLIDGGNELKIYDTSGKLRLTQSMFISSQYIWFKKNETAVITKVGIYKGKYVDLALKNINTTDAEINAMDTAHISTTTSGNIIFYRNNYLGYSDERITYLNMNVVDHETGEKISNISFYLPSYRGSIDYSNGRFVSAYDKNLTNKYFIDTSDIFANTKIAVDSTSSKGFDLLTTSGRNTSDQGYFTVYGTTGSTGYKFGVESEVNSASAISLLNPNTMSIIPNEYPPLTINETATGNDNGTTATFVMKQLLPRQRTNSYIPVDDSFELTMTEKNTGFLAISPDDFHLYVDNIEVPNDGIAYKLATEKSKDTTTIKLTLTSDFLKKINTGTTKDSTLEIRQTSTVINDQTKVTTAVKDSSITMPITSDLKYTLQNGLKKDIPAVEKEVSLSLNPRLTADVVPEITVYQGMTTGNLELETLVSNLRNEDYPWDKVTATSDEPDTILTTLGEQTISLTLKSSTFGNTKKIDVPLIVEEAPVDNAVLTWDSSGSTPVKAKTKQLSQAILGEFLEETLYWKTTAEKRNYSILVTDADKPKETSVLSTINVSNDATVDSYIEEKINIPVSKLKVGTNNLVLQIFSKENAGPEDDSLILDKINLTITMTGQLKLASVPSELKWTNRKLASTMNNLPRDTGNTMELSVIDTRELSDAEKNWSVGAQLKIKDAKSTPFELVWKDKSTDQPVSIVNKQNVLTRATATKNEDVYSKTWNENLGILLNGTYDLKVGDYSNQVVVSWTLYDTAAVE